MAELMQHIVLAQRPNGAPKPEDFRLESAPMPTPAQGEVLVEVLYMSLDPYMRGRMDDAKSYAQPVPIGGPMEGGAVGRVLESKSDAFQPGDHVFGMFGWASHGVQPAKAVNKLDPKMGPLTAALGVLGMPGFTGWYGLTQIGKPKSGETLVVAAATGPVGSMVGQLARLAGLRTIGIAGGADKCALATETFGFDACLDHRAYETARDLRQALSAHCPDGIDIYFENVGGKVFDAVLPLMNTFGRIPLCGMISGYNKGALGGVANDGPDNLPRFYRSLLVNRMTVSGFIISDHFDQYPTFMAQVAPQVAAGKIAFKEDIAEGLENAPAAFIRLLEGGNFGKQIVKLAE